MKASVTVVHPCGKCGEHVEANNDKRRLLQIGFGEGHEPFATSQHIYPPEGIDCPGSPSIRADLEVENPRRKTRAWKAQRAYQQMQES